MWLWLGDKYDKLERWPVHCRLAPAGRMLGHHRSPIPPYGVEPLLYQCRLPAYVIAQQDQEDCTAGKGHLMDTFVFLLT